jgi:hypothetical protein
MRLGWNAKESSARIRGIAKIVAVLFILGYAVLYSTEPFSETWNVILINAFLVVASSVTAYIATMIWARYDQSDAPRRVWGNFAIGLWLWAAAELTWGYLNVTQGEVPEGISDVFWVAAYFFFGQALLLQYRILAHPNKSELWTRIVVAILSLLMLNLLIYRLFISTGASPNPFDAALNSFYPAADLLLVLVAIWLASHFMGGAFSRPWLGLLAFAFADLLYAWAEISGVYAWGINQANLLSTSTDIAYFAAYVVLGLGVLSQWVFLKYGLYSPTAAN